MPPVFKTIFCSDKDLHSYCKEKGGLNVLVEFILFAAFIPVEYKTEGREWDVDFGNPTHISIHAIESMRPCRG